MAKRIQILDVYKGLLILIVLFHHISAQIDGIGINECVKQYNLYMLPTYCAWFMPAFFLTTGFCSNFNKQFLPFLYSNFRTLLWPAITSFAIIYTFRSIWYYDKSILVDSLSLIPLWGFNWFLMALFLSKILLWVINRYFVSNLIKGMLFIFIAFIAIYMNDVNFLGNNWLHHRHALYLSLFLFIGYVIKSKDVEYKKYFRICGGIYIPLLFVSMKTIGVLPGIAGVWINFDVSQVLFHVLLAITGSCFCLCIANLFINFKFLNFIGINSLVFYLFHIDALRISEKTISVFIINPESLSQVLFFDLLTLIMSVCLCSILVYAFSTKYLHWIIKWP